MNDYKPCELVYRFDHEAAERYSFKFNRLFKDRLPLNNNCSVVKREMSKIWNKNLRGYYKNEYGALTKKVREAVLSYLVYKTLKTCLQYRNYGVLLGIRSFTEKELLQVKKDRNGYFLAYTADKVKKVVKEILFQDKDIHINLKAQQLLTYVERGHYTTSNLAVPEGYKDDPTKLIGYGWSKMPVQVLYDLNKNDEGKIKPFRTFDEVYKLMPPAIFDWDINFTKGDDEKDRETLSQMSSGERQLMHSISYIIYHLKNLQSVTDGDYRIRYHNVCMVFDEAELYYHPEFQRKFLTRLMEVLSWCHINTNIIRGINILIATHSPFVLSDVPLSNTLYLDNGKVEYKEKETFCGNIHEMLGENFFLEYSIGDVARKNVEDFIMLYNARNDKETEKENKELFLAERPRFEYVTAHIADGYLHRTISGMMDVLSDMYEGKDTLERQIERKRQELDALLEMKRIKDDKGKV